MSSDISRSLQEIFGGIPSHIDEHRKYFTFDSTNEEFQCVPCGKKKVKIVYMNKSATAKNFEAHVFSRSHREMSYSRDENINALSITFKGKIPQIVFNSICVLDIYGNDYKCVICDKILKVKSDSSATECSFSYHLLSFDHKRKWEQYKVNGGQLVNVFGEIPGFVRSNQEFIRLTRSGKNCVCTLCNVLLIVYEDLEDTTDEFKDHFCSSEHIRNIKQEKVLSLLPVMKKNGNPVPSFLIRNIDYMTNSGTDLFCTLCNEIVKCNQTDFTVTEQNLKLHFMSTYHEENVFITLDDDNEVFDCLNSIIGEFNSTVLENLRYLRLTENSFNCSICDSEITQLDAGENYEEIKEHIIDHFESDFHESNLSDEIEARKNLSESLEDLFGAIPSMILENISYLEFKGGNNFKCTLCDATLQTNMNSDDPEHVARITQENFEKHLGTTRHNEAVAIEKQKSFFMQTELQKLFEPIPQIVDQNWDHIQYDDDNDGILCVLCDRAITIDNGNKKEEITLQNFITHLHSAAHSSNLKNRGQRISDVTERLKSIFGGVPNYILSNLEYLYEDENSFFCDACDPCEIRLGSCSDTSMKNFHQHLTGYRHKSNIDEIQASIDNAYQFLDNNFCLPVFLLKDIDFWEKWCDDLYCTLCQQVITIDYADLKETRESLRYHVNSKRHMVNMEHF